MNKVTRDIMEILKCSADHAVKVRQNMDIDFSECTQKQFVREVKTADEFVKSPDFVDLYA